MTSSSVLVCGYVSSTSIGKGMFGDLLNVVHCITGSSKIIQYHQISRYSSGYSGQFMGLMGVLVDKYGITRIE
jgi:hypothetical protein